MKYITTPQYSLEFGSIIDSSFKELLENQYADSKKIILVDENTHEHCLEYLITNFEVLSSAEVMLLPAGEENKVMEVCFQVWEALSEYKITRKDLIINLGGGLVTDMGGFIASIYKRGIDFINVPTTLLAMVDASIGGKTGVDLGRYKNQLGLFAFPKSVFVDPVFLATLPEKEIQNGYAEMLKHALIADKEQWLRLKESDIAKLSIDDIIQSVSIKQHITSLDPYEQNERKKLNFGHTFGHAFEGFLLGSENQISHGYAVALGIICESFVSFLNGFLIKEQLEEISFVIMKEFQLIAFQEEDYPTIFELMLQDKKNSKQRILSVTLNEIGNAQIDCEVTYDEFVSALDYLLKLVRSKGKN